MSKGIPMGAIVTEKGPVDTDRLVEDHKNLVYHLIRRTVRDRTAHEEIFQEVFLNVLESLCRFEGGSKLSTWIASITVHTCYKFIQKASTRNGSNRSVTGSRDGPNRASLRTLKRSSREVTSESALSGTSRRSLPSTRCPSPCSISKG